MNRLSLAGLIPSAVNATMTCAQDSLLAAPQLVNPPSFCCTELSQLSPLSTAFFALLLLL